MGQVLDVFLAQGTGHTGHVARVVVAVLGFEIFECFDHIVKILSGHFGDFVLSLELAQMAHGA